MVEFNLADLFEAVAGERADAEAAVAGTRRLTYGGLDERAGRLAGVLEAWGLGPGDHVGLYLSNGTEYLEGMLAAFKIRAVPINVNYRYLAGELTYLFNDAELSAVIHNAEFAERIADIRADVPTLVHTLAVGDEYEAALAGTEPAAHGRSRSGDDRYILYTGGTTGLPKGVVWRQEDLFFAALGGGNPGGPPLERPEDIVERARRGRTRSLPACPFIHGTAHWSAFTTLLSGGTVVVSPDRSLDPERLWDVVELERVTFLVIVGDAFARPLLEALVANPGRWDLGELSVVLSGGAILSPSVKRELIERLPAAMVVDGYGASETGGQGQMVPSPVDDAGPPRFTVGPDTAVLDDDGCPIAPGSGVVGRLARTGHIPLGYHRDPEKTAATFPVIGGVRWAIPGDHATVEADGSIRLLGRGSVVINSGGEKVFPEEVEAVLKGHPSVVDVVVVGVADARWGERVTAVVQPRPGTDPTLDVLAAHCRGELAAYKCPKGVVLVDEVVRSPSGKPDYRWARQAAAAG